MINCLIIEDEEPAVTRLSRLLQKNAPDFDIIDSLDSVKESVEWFNTNKHPDVIFLDIQLADGLSFDIFKQIKTNSFVIFITAYDEYAIKAFELNSIDYLLKPINEDKLKVGLEKFRRLNSNNDSLDIAGLISKIEINQTEYKKRFIIKVGSKIKSIECQQIAFIYVFEKSTFITSIDNKSYPIDFSLDKLEELLNPDDFFRVNRQFIINYHSIEQIFVLSKSRIKIKTNPAFESEIMVSSHKSHIFRQWLDR